MSIRNPQSEIRNPSARIDFDFACVKCDYNLRTLPTDGACPECATPISDSLRPDRLRFADVLWLGRVRDGMGGALWTTVVFFGIFVAAITAQFSLDVSTLFFLLSSPFFVLSLLGVPFLVLSICFCVLMLRGLFLITTPDPNRPGRDRALRVWCRWLGVASALLAVGAGMDVGSFIFEEGGAWLSGAAAQILVALYLRRLARRGEVKGLTKMMTTLVWGGGALIVLGAIALPFLSNLFLSDLASNAWGIAVLAYAIVAIVGLVWFRRVLATERVLAVER